VFEVKLQGFEEFLGNIVCKWSQTSEPKAEKDNLPHFQTLEGDNGVR
jgi:hypothetical protein